MDLKSGYHPEGPRDLSFGNLKGFESGLLVELLWGPAGRWG